MATDYDPLKFRRDELADAEGRLRNARDSLKKAAENLGLATSGLFSGSFCVPRATADKWVETAEQKFYAREQENFEFVKAALGDLAAATKTKDDSPGKRTDVEPKGGASPRLAGDNSDETLRLATAISEAGRERRGEAKPPALPLVERSSPPRRTVDPNAQMPPKGSLAEKIILAGMRRRGEIE